MKQFDYRRPVPSGYEKGTLALVGITPLLMNSSEVDRESEDYRAFKGLSTKRGKTLDDERRLQEMEWAFGLYLDDKLGPYIPAKNIHELLRSAATKYRLGEEIRRSLVVTEFRIPLSYDGPRDQKGLSADSNFRYTTMVANAGPSKGRVVRCRPCFDGWALEAELAWDPEDLDFDRLVQIVDRSQKYGLGDYRPTFGAFEAVLMKGEKKGGGVNVSAVKPRDKIAEQAHKNSRKRVAA